MSSEMSTVRPRRRGRGALLAAAALVAGVVATGPVPSAGASGGPDLQIIVNGTATPYYGGKTIYIQVKNIGSQNTYPAGGVQLQAYGSGLFGTGYGWSCSVVTPSTGGTLTCTRSGLTAGQTTPPSFHMTQQAGTGCQTPLFIAVLPVPGETNIANNAVSVPGMCP